MLYNKRILFAAIFVCHCTFAITIFFLHKLCSDTSEKQAQHLFLQKGSDLQVDTKLPFEKDDEVLITDKVVTIFDKLNKLKSCEAKVKHVNYDNENKADIDLQFKLYKINLRPEYLTENGQKSETGFHELLYALIKDVAKSLMRSGTDGHSESTVVLSA